VLFKQWNLRQESQYDWTMNDRDVGEDRLERSAIDVVSGHKKTLV